MKCEKCGKDSKPLYQVPVNLFVCFHCVTPAEWAEYPGSYERALLKVNRAARERANFGHDKQAAETAV